MIKNRSALKGQINKLYELRGYSAYESAVINGFNGTEAEWLEYIRGKSAYEIAVKLGFEGTEEEWLEYIRGKSAYEIAVKLGYEGTEAEWIEYIRGKSAYELAVKNGFKGTEAEWLDSLKGSQIVNTELIGITENGDYIYRHTYDDGRTSDFLVPKGEKGDKGDRGDSGVTAPVNGFFTMSVDENGNLYVHTTDGAEPAMEYDETTGNLYFVTEDN